MKREHWRVFLLVILALTSAVLLAEMKPTEETAERLLKARVTELETQVKESGIQGLAKGKNTQHFSVAGQPTKEPKKDGFTLHYIISSLFEGEPKYRDLDITVTWHSLRGETDKQQRQLRHKTFLKGQL